MSKKAGEFVAKLSQDPQKRDRFMENPDAVMDEHGGLSDQDREVLRTKDPEKIQGYVGDDGPPGCFVVP